MNLSDLNPSFSGDVRGKGYLTIDCPQCRPPHRFTIPTTGGVAKYPRWHIDGSPPDWATVSLSPSIDYRGCWHGFITNGQAQ